MFCSHLCLNAQNEISPECWIQNPVPKVRVTPHLDSIYPDWMFEGFVREFEYKKISDTRILVQFNGPNPLTDSNRYTDDANDSLKHLTGIDDATMSEYSKIYILDSLARMESVYPDSNRILEIVMFEQDTCFWERRCRIGLLDYCCSGGDTTQIDEILGYPILTDAASGIRYIEYWYKEACNSGELKTGCCEIVYRYKSNEEYPAQFVFYEGPIRRTTSSGGGCSNWSAPISPQCPTPASNRRQCRRCFENN